MSAGWKVLIGAIALMPAAAASEAYAQTERAQIVEAEFGVIRPTTAGPAFVPSRAVSTSAGEQYGWRLRVKTDKPTVRWREEFVLPASAPNWGVGPGGATVVNSDGRSAVTERETAPLDGVICNFWGVADGDPKGTHRITVTVGEDSRTFEFEVE